MSHHSNLTVVSNFSRPFFSLLTDKHMLSCNGVFIIALPLKSAEYDYTVSDYNNSSNIKPPLIIEAFIYEHLLQTRHH